MGIRDPILDFNASYIARTLGSPPHLRRHYAGAAAALRRNRSYRVAAAQLRRHTAAATRRAGGAKVPRSAGEASANSQRSVGKVSAKSRRDNDDATPMGITAKIVNSPRVCRITRVGSKNARRIRLSFACEHSGSARAILSSPSVRTRSVLSSPAPHLSHFRARS